MYQYLPIEKAKVGDIVEVSDDSIYFARKGSLHLVSKVTKHSIYAFSINYGSFAFGSGARKLNLIKTKPIEQAVKGDTVICYRPISTAMEKFMMKPFKYICKGSDGIHISGIGLCTPSQFIACCNENDIIKKVRIKKQQKPRNKL